MKIAQIAPISESVPAKKYGGTERVIYCLTEGLVKRGHDVTLFASGDSETSAKLVSVFPTSLRAAKIKDPYGLNEWPLLHIGNAYKHYQEFDIIHDHTNLSLPTANLIPTPTIITLHNPIMNKKMFKILNNPYLVSISQSQRNFAPKLNIIGTVYNGLSMDHYPFSETNNGYLLYVGQIKKEKGLHIAIEVAEKLHLPLIIAAKLDPVQKKYFNTYVAPHLSDQIRWVGEVDETERNKLMSEALCLLHPVTWPEPFGLAMIEAMSCGCPVVAFNKGSIPEVVQHGKSGFVVNTTPDMIKAVKNISKIDRQYCRTYALKKFTAERMVDEYENIYYKILNSYVEKNIPLVSRRFLTQKVPANQPLLFEGNPVYRNPIRKVA